MSTGSTDSLTNHFLVSMPGKHLPFPETVIYICSHHPGKTATGLFINKPMESTTVKDLLDRFEIEGTTQQAHLATLPVLCGGPFGKQKSFVFHPARICKQMVEVSESETALVEIMEGRGPQHFFVTLGYMYWENGSFEEDLKNQWLIACPHFKVLFETPFEERWRAAGVLAGVDFNQMSSLVGHG